MNKLYVLYDPSCLLCLRSAAWLERQRTYIPVVPVARGLEMARTLFPTVKADGDELVAVSDTGDVYRGHDAWLIVLYTLRRHRVWAFRLARPGWRHLARAALHSLSQHRHDLSRLLKAPAASTLPGCESGACRV